MEDVDVKGVLSVHGRSPEVRTKVYSGRRRESCVFAWCSLCFAWQARGIVASCVGGMPSGGIVSPAAARRMRASQCTGPHGLVACAGPPLICGCEFVAGSETQWEAHATCALRPIQSPVISGDSGEREQ